MFEGEKIGPDLRENMNGSEASTSGEGGGRKDNLTDQRLEYHDPTPNVHDLFVSFNKKFFNNALSMVEVKWSNKMTSCAGLCYYQSPGGLCSIKLSAPLLMYRPRKDLVETLLHEMIHAYLFVTKNFKDRDDHGPEFQKHMHRINREAGTNITVFHSFHDEVAFYQTHIWRCNGPCQNDPPYFGFVKRAMNRSPGPSDPWWQAHLTNCGGSFDKISEPDKHGKKKNGNGKGKSRKTGTGKQNIRDFFKGYGPENPSTSNQNKGGRSNASNATSTIVRPDEGERSGSSQGNDGNPGTSREGTATRATPQTSQSGDGNDGNASGEQRDVNETVRNIWRNKYPSSSEKGKKRDNPDTPPPTDPTLEPKKKVITCPVCGRAFSENVINEHVDECLEGDNSVEFLFETPPAGNGHQRGQRLIQCPVCSESLEQEELNEHLEVCFSFTFENEDTAGDDEADPGKVRCPCCSKYVKEKSINEHIDECLTLMSLKSNSDSA